MSTTRLRLSSMQTRVKCLAVRVIKLGLFIPPTGQQACNGFFHSLANFGPHALFGLEPGGKLSVPLALCSSTSGIAYVRAGVHLRHKAPHVTQHVDFGSAKSFSVRESSACVGTGRGRKTSALGETATVRESGCGLSGFIGALKFFTSFS